MVNSLAEDEKANRALGRLASLPIHLRLQHAHERQVAILLGVIESVADDELIGIVKPM
jgi:hypothetical protein